MGLVSAEEINISEMNIEQKVAQMVIVSGDKFDSRFLDLGVGGIFLTKQKSKEDYKKLISKYQTNSKIKLFVATDMEGYWNPFDDFYKSKNFAQINNGEEAYALGKEHGNILKELGFNIDFSPVVEVRNSVWPGRSFTGSNEEVKEKIKSYIKGLQEQEILATAKHYPGGSMIKNPHIFKVRAKIYPQDLELFDFAIKNKVDAIMVGHSIVYGAMDSKGKQSSVSGEIIMDLRDKFNGLIITDAITMMGLRWSYLFSFNRKVYVDAINAGNDIILDVWKYSGYKKVKKRINNVIKAIEKGEISEERIDESLKRILEKKGYKVVE
ncbi:MAG: glycoside hydrolase family 3 protein [Nanoarchaeota archaeon]|nr:glycoside hydrolase family 3 protein [Nanoarchaeota archaeon]